MGQTTIPKEGVRALLDLDWLQKIFVASIDVQPIWMCLVIYA